MNKDLMLDEVLEIEANTDLAAVVTTKGSVMLVMMTMPTNPSRYEVRFRKDKITTSSVYTADELEKAVNRFNQYAREL